MPRDHKPTALLLAISNAATRRRQQAVARKEAQEVLSQARREEGVLGPARLRAARGEAEAQAKQDTARLHRERLRGWHVGRCEASLRDRLSRAEVDDRVLLLVTSLVDELRTSSEPPLSDQRLGERLSAFNEKVVSLWNANQARIRTALPRYVEGYPVRERIQPPKFGAQMKQKPSGLGDCLQCLARGLSCSLCVRAREEGEEDGEGVVRGECRRCVADGHRCIVEHEVEEHADGEKGQTGVGKDKEEREESGLWDWWDGVPDREQHVDSAAEAIEMWEGRRRGTTLELVGGRMLWVESGGFAPRGVLKASDGQIKFDC
ncbi:hypothetical protein J3F83DRAFT_306501 [Trichoderma novae-zelandiae]